MNSHFYRSLLGVLLFAASAASLAEDIDLFVKNEGAAGDPPNVLLVLDNAANFVNPPTSGFTTCPGVTGLSATMTNTNAGLEQCAIYKVVEALEPGTVSMGVMMFNANGFFADCPGGVGGCLVYPIKKMTATNKAALLAWLKTWVIVNTGKTPAGAFNVKANSKANAQVMQESWAYFAGKTGVSGRDYSTIRPGGSCNNNYVIMVGNADGNSGSPNDGANNADDALNGTLTGTNALMNASPAATSVQKALITNAVPVSCEGGGSKALESTAVSHSNRGHYAAEWARYMSSQDITTYTIGLLGPACKKEYEALLKIMGDQEGGGKYFPTNNFDELKAAFAEALSEIQSVNSVFASVSLPVSVNTQGTYLNQVFVGMFRPDPSAGPRWLGNLKQYKLGYLDNTLKLLDADSAGAISSGESGFISENARSFWTPPKSQTLSTLYWSDLTIANSIGYLPASETPDGNMVEKGGQGYKLRTITPADRKVLTCGATCTNTLSNFDNANTNITKAKLGDAAMSDAARTSLINWARGLNVDADSIANSTLNGAGEVTEKTAAEAAVLMRPSSHGDVVHSRPVAINFSTDASPAVVVFYGGNDGILRAVNGNRDGGNAVGGKQPGQELWSFVAPESYGIFERLKADSPLISYPNVDEAVSEPKDYGFDGPVTAYKATSSAWVFASMRRGGRMIYAFDVPDSNPANPTLKWRAGCDESGCTSGISAMGQTWGVPTVLKSAANADKPMLIVGGGYDDCEDADPATCSSSSNGHAIYLLDAEDGSVLNTFDSSDVEGDMGGVIGDITVVRDNDDLATYAYASDLSGNVYRISGTANAPIGSVDPADWVITKIASLGGTGANARKFMFGPDVVIDNGLNYIMLGSGDREKPVATYTSASAVNNYFFMIKDDPTNTTWLSSESANCSANIICLDSLLGITTTATPAQADIDAKKGWYLGLSTSEKVVTSALTIFGTVYFSTHQPDLGLSEGSCEAKLGESRSYAISYKNAEGPDGPRYVDLVGDGLPPSPVAGLVTLDDGTTVPFCIGCGDKPLEGTEPPTPPGADQPKSRVFWNIEQ